MAKGYWIGRVDVRSDEGYKPYAMGNQAIFKKYGARYIVRAGKFECVEGNTRSRNACFVDRGTLRLAHPRHRRVSAARVPATASTAS